MDAVKEFFRPKDACLYLGCKMATLYRWEKAGVLRNKQVISGRLVGWRKRDLDQALATLLEKGDVLAQAEKAAGDANGEEQCGARTREA